MKKFLKERIAARGYSVVRDHGFGSPIALEGGHPLEHLLCWPRSRFLFSVPAGRIRGWGGRRTEKDVHPLVGVVADYFERGVDRYQDSVLASFATLNSFADGAQALGLSGEAAPGFSRLAPYAALFPWESREPDTSGIVYRATMIEELCPHTSQTIERLLSDRTLRGQIMVDRLLRLARSIRAEGFRPDRKGFHPIEGQLLVSDSGDWMILIRQGEHRVAALAALASPFLPVLVDPLRIAVVREMECNYWPQVRSGRITAEGARDVFRRTFRGGHDAPHVNVAGWP